MTAINTSAIDEILTYLAESTDGRAVGMRAIFNDHQLALARRELVTVRKLAEEGLALKPPVASAPSPTQQPAPIGADNKPIGADIIQAIRRAMGFDAIGFDVSKEHGLLLLMRAVIKDEVGDHAVVLALNNAAEKAIADVDLEDLARDAVLHAMRDVDMDAIAKDVCEETAESAVADHVEDAVSSAAENAVNDADLDAAIAEHLDNNLDADMVKEAVESALVRRKMVLTFGE